MVRCETYFIRREHLATRNAFDAGLRHEQVVESGMRRPRGKRMTHEVRLQKTKGIDIPGIEDALERAVSAHATFNRAGRLRMSSSSPGASVLKSPTSTCGPC